MSSPTSRYIQYGCGLCAPASWRNFDASPSLRIQRLPVIGKLYQWNGFRFPDNVEHGDIVSGLPVAAGTARAVFASHVLEHLALEEFRIAIRNTHALLEAGGIFRLIVPDLEQLARRYVARADSDAALEFIRAIGMGQESRHRGLLALVRAALGNSLHLWMWDYRALERELVGAGFDGIRRGQAGDSAEERFREVEDPERFVDSVAVECSRAG